MITAILIDDEPDCLDILAHEIQQVSDEIQILAQCHDSREAGDLIRQLKPDVVFLDIEMPYHSGFEVLDQFDTIDFHVIFTTAFEQYAVKAFRYFALDYILKPINREHLVSALAKVKDKVDQSKEDLLRTAIEVMRSRDKPLDRIAVPTSEGYKFVRFSEIIRCEADGNYSIIVRQNGSDIIISKSLKYLDDLLPADLFIRIHQSHIVHIGEILEYNRTSGGFVTLRNKEKISVARSKQALMTRVVERYSKRK